MRSVSITQKLGKSSYAWGLVALFFSQGCGGGGTSSVQVHPLYTQNRISQPGDSSTYNVTGNATQNGVTVIGNGSVTEGVSSANFAGRACIAFDLSGTLTGGGHSITVNELTYSAYDTQGDELYLGDNNGTGGASRATTPPFILVPSIIGPSSSTSGTVTFTDGSSSTYSFVINGTQQVTVPAGTFDTWKITFSQSTSFGDTIVQSLYYAPQIGMFVKMNGTDSSSSGSVSLAMEMTSSNVPLG